MPETIADLIGQLEADIAHCGVIDTASVSRVYSMGRWFRVTVSVRGSRSMAWCPRFRTRGEAIDYREATTEVLGRVS